MKKKIYDEGLSQDDEYFKIGFGISISLKILISAVLTYFAIYEINTRRALGTWKNYFAFVWNIFDCVLLLFYIPVLIFDILDYYDYQYFADSTSKVLLCIFVFLSFVKFYYYLRVFNGFSSLVYMLL
jgi:hypothetical protein